MVTLPPTCDMTCGIPQYLISFDTLSVINTSYLNANVANMELVNFDGVIFNAIMDSDGIEFAFKNFENAPLAWSEFNGPVADMQATNFLRFQHNFLLMNVRVGPAGINWFDTSWMQFIEEKWALAGRFVREADIRGVMFDAEEYNGDVWDPTALSTFPAHSVAEHRLAAAYWAERWGNAYRGEAPNGKILLTIFNAGFMGDPGFDLYSYFLNGLSDAMVQNDVSNRLGSINMTTENTYPAKFQFEFDFYNTPMRAAASLPGVSPNYPLVMRYGLTVAPAGTTGFWDNTNFALNWNTPAELEDGIVFMLNDTDEYSWIYSAPTSFFGAFHPQIAVQYRDALREARRRKGLSVW